MKNLKYLLCISGLDGAGKTTQCKLLYECLSPMNPVYYTFGNVESSKDVNRALINYVKKTNLILTDNQIHVIKSALYMYFDMKQLAQNNDFHDKIVIMDRYVETIYAHAQFYGLTPDVIYDLFKEVYIEPDFYFFLDLSPNICHKRILQRNKPIEPHEELDSLVKLYGFYKSAVKAFDINLINADRTPSELHQDIISYIKMEK